MSANSEQAAIGCFRRQLATYLSYQNEFRDETGIMMVSFHCVTDSQNNEVAEVVGIVAV